MTRWLLVAAIVASTVAADVLQSREMKQHGEIEDFRPQGILQTLKGFLGRPYLLLAIFFMALSFFAFLALLSIAELSFAVPATAASYVGETILAKYVLNEKVDRRRWTGALLVAFGVALLAG
ncbi:MAG: EamA family transporter [Bryobacteraceae bacterium]